MGVRSRLCAGQSSSSTPISTNHFCMHLTLCMGALSCCNRKGPPQTVATKLEAKNHLECHCMLFSLHWSLALIMKNSPRPLFLRQQTLQLALCIGAGSVLMASAKHRFVHSDSQMVKHDSLPQRMHFHCSTAVWYCAW